MPKHEVWFAIPSANPENCRRVLPKWRERGYKVAVLQNYEKGDIPADITVWRDSYPGWAPSVNILCREVIPKSCNLIVTGGDDMLPDPNHTADELAEQFFNRFPDSFGVMQPHGDEYMCAKAYCGSPFVGRKWFETMYNGGGCMYDGYHHNYADVELYWVAKGLDALWVRPDLSHFHAHFTRDGKPQPAYWSTVKQNDLNDCLLYIARAHQHFMGHEPKGFTPAHPFNRNMDRQAMLALAKQRLVCVSIDNPYSQVIQRALEHCATAGQDPVAIYGFGLHTQMAGAALREPPVRVTCIIDDNASNHGRRAWNIPVVSRETALAMGVKAVILSGNSVEDRLWENAVVFREHGIPVHRLYGKSVTNPEASTGMWLVHT